MVIVFSHGQLDFVVQTSIAFAQAKLNFGQNSADTRVEAFSQTLDIGGETRIALVGHGQPGQISGVTAETIGDFLASKVKQRLTKLIVTSCFAGAQVGNQPDTSVVEVIARKLRKHGQGWLEVVGYNGPSIKNAELGSFAAVVDPGQVAPARTIQATELKNAGNSAPPVSLAQMSPTQPGATAQQMSKFYSNFIGELDRQNMLLKGDEVARICVVPD